MNELTPNEIADYPLRTAVRGYRVEQVDELLDRVADRIEVLQKQTADLREQLQAAELRAEEASSTEATLKRTLVTAQRAAEDTVAEARTEAARIRSEAQEQADELLGDARAEAEELRARASEELEQAQVHGRTIREGADREVAGLRDAAAQFRTRMREQLDAHQTLLERAPSPTELPAVGETSSSAGEPDRAIDTPEEGSSLFAANSPSATARDAGQDFSD